MPRKSTLKELPPDVLARVNKMLTDGQVTIDDVVAWLEEKGHPKSRSSVGRYKRQIDKVAARLRESREVTDAVMSELGDAAAQGKQGRLLVEMARTVIFDLLMKLQDSDEALDPKGVAMLGKGLAETARALRLDQDFETKIREQVAREIREETADTAEKTMREAGLSADTVAAIKAGILGVKEGLMPLDALPDELAGRELPDILLGYQQRLLSTTALHQVTICEKSRRIGMTWAVAADAVLTSAAARGAGGMDTLYLGYNLDMAREFIDTCAMWAKSFAKGASEVEEFIFKDNSKDDAKTGDRDIQAFRITFASGFEIVALTSKPRSLRGRQGYVILDEAAFHDDLDEVIKAAMALLIWGGKVLIISTHDGEANTFNQLCNDVRARRRPYALVRVDFDEALDDGLYKRICLVTGKEWSAEAEAAWRQEIIDFYGDGADEELFCLPREGSGTYLSQALVQARMADGIPVLRWSMSDSFAHLPDHLREAEARAWWEANILPELKRLDPRLQHFFGGDFGRSGDLSVKWPLALMPNMVRRTPFLYELRNIPFQQQEQLLFWTVDLLPRFTAGAMDARGNGQYLAERAQQRYGAGRIEAVMLSEGWYRENMPPYKAAFEDAMIVIPRDADVGNDHRAFVLDRGVARIPDKRQKGQDKGQRHGDAAVAGALAYYATLLDVHEYGYEAAPPPRGRFDEPSGWGDDRDAGVGLGLRGTKGAW